MKKSLILLVGLLLFNCSQDVDENTSGQNLKKQELITFTSATLFSSTALREQLQNSETNHFKFKITLNDQNIIIVKSIAVDVNNKELNTVIGAGFNYELNLERLQNSQDVSQEEIEKQGEILAKHIIQPKVAYNYIKDWNAILKNNESIKDYVSYEGAYVKYGIVEKEIIEAIVNKTNTNKVAIFWGLNTKKKLTPVFMGIDNTNTVMFGSSTNKDDTTDYIYDTIRLVPPFGN